MNILIFGSSITQGFWDPRGGWPAYLWENYVNEYLEDKTKQYHTVFNLGISGNTSHDVLQRFDNEVQARHKSGEAIFIFSIGVNNTVREGRDNFWSTPENYTQPVSRGDYWHSNKRVALFDPVLKKFCQENDFPYIHLLNLFKDREDELLFDGLHPNQKGHKLIYEKVKPELEKLLKV